MSWRRRKVSRTWQELEKISTGPSPEYLWELRQKMMAHDQLPYAARQLNYAGLTSVYVPDPMDVRMARQRAAEEKRRQPRSKPTYVAPVIKPYV